MCLRSAAAPAAARHPPFRAPARRIDAPSFTHSIPPPLHSMTLTQNAVNADKELGIEIHYLDQAGTEGLFLCARGSFLFLSVAPSLFSLALCLSLSLPSLSLSRSLSLSPFSRRSLAVPCQGLQSVVIAARF